MRKYPILISIALFYAILLSVWVPIDSEIGPPYNYVNLFDGLRPRAIFGTIIELLVWTNLGIDNIANILRIISAAIWVYCINAQLYQSAFDNKKIRQALTHYLSS
jgi:hypothetical protein